MAHSGLPGSTAPAEFGRGGDSADQERTFGGYTIPTSLRIGYFFGSDGYASEGEFIRITVDEARFD